MYRVDNSTAAAAMPAPGVVGPNPDGFFTDGDPGGGIPATIVPADWLNAVQEEISYVIEQAGDTLDKADRTQLRAAILAMITANLAADASETVKGIIEIATAAEAQALTDDLRAITPLKLKNAFQGSNQSLAASGYQKLPGGLILQWGVTASIALNSTSVITLPMTFPNANFGVVCNGVSADLSDTDNWGVSSVTTSQFTLTNGGVAKAYYWHALGN